jgi:hypothetical protein
MDAAHGYSSLDARSTAPELAHFRLMALRTIAALLSFVAVVLLARRIVGALVEPLPITLLLLVGATAIATAVIVQLLNAHSELRLFTSLFEGIEILIAGIAILVIAACLSIAGSSILGLLCLWTATLVSGAVLVRPWSVESPTNPLAGFTSVSRDDAAMDVWPPEKLTSAPAVVEVEDEWMERSLTQRLQYRSEPTGIAIDGWVRVQFSTGQRVAIAHVAFCPAFETVPEADCEVLDGQSCEIRPTLVLPWGIRWELRLDAEAPEPTEVVLGFAAFEQQ